MAMRIAALRRLPLLPLDSGINMHHVIRLVNSKPVTPIAAIMQDGDPFEPALFNKTLPAGSCGYGEISRKQYPFWGIAGINPANPLASRPMKGCGSCVIVQCQERQVRDQNDRCSPTACRSLHFRQDQKAAVISADTRSDSPPLLMFACRCAG